MGWLSEVFPGCDRFGLRVYLRWFARADGLRERPCGIRVIVWALAWLGDGR